MLTLRLDAPISKYGRITISEVLAIRNAAFSLGEQQRCPEPFFCFSARLESGEHVQQPQDAASTRSHQDDSPYGQPRSTDRRSANNSGCVCKVFTCSIQPRRHNNGWSCAIPRIDSNAQYYGSYWGRKTLMHKDHPNFRPQVTFEQAIAQTPPLPERER